MREDKPDELINKLLALGEQQPPSQPGSGPEIATITPALFAKWTRARAEKGEAKYGLKLQAGNGRNPLADATQELVDAVQYTIQAAIEREWMEHRIKQLEVGVIFVLNNAETKNLSMLNRDALTEALIGGDRPGEVK